jgi:hypothetical protein
VIVESSRSVRTRFVEVILVDPLTGKGCLKRPPGGEELIELRSTRVPVGRWARVLVASLLIVVGPLAGRSEAQALPFEVAVTPTTALIDGQNVTVKLSGTATEVWSYKVLMCRGGVDYPANQPVPIPINDRNCPASGISTSWIGATGGLGPGNFEVTDTVSIGTGTAAWRVNTTERGPDGRLIQETVSATCDSANPCVLLVEVKRGSALVGVATVPLTFADEVAASGCQGRAPGVLRFAGPHRMPPAVREWNRGTCALPASPGLAVSGSGSGETDALEQFAAGTADLAYTGLGYPVAEPAQRPLVPVPVGINAAVLAVAGYYKETFESPGRPIDDVRLTLDELNLLLNTDGTTVTSDDRLAAAHRIVERNHPALGPVNLGPTATTLYAAQLFPTAAGPARVVAPSEADAASWMMTRHLDSVLGNAWRVFDRNADAWEGTPRGAHASLAQASPPFPNLEMYTGPVSLLKGKTLNTHSFFVLRGTASWETKGPAFVLTDLASARALDLKPVKIMRDEGAEAVGPTPEAMAAAAGAMTRDENGFLQTDPANVPDGAYPLTFVEYVVAPQQALHVNQSTGTCTVRSDSQKLLHDWLTFTAGDTGQQTAAGAGLSVLTPALADDAREAITNVGSVPAPPNCTPPPPAPGGESGGAPTVAGGVTGQGLGGSTGAAGDFGSGGFTATFTGTGAADGGAGESAAAGAPPGAPSDGATAGNDDAIPIYAGVDPFNPWVTAGAVLVLLLVIVAASLISSGRRLRRSPEEGRPMIAPAPEPADRFPSPLNQP